MPYATSTHTRHTPDTTTAQASSRSSGAWHGEPLQAGRVQGKSSKCTPSSPPDHHLTPAPRSLSYAKGDLGPTARPCSIPPRATASSRRMLTTLLPSRPRPCWPWYLLAAHDAVWSATLGALDLNAESSFLSPPPPTMTTTTTTSPRAIPTTTALRWLVSSSFAAP